MVKNLPAMQETWDWFLGWEDPLEVAMATHSYSCLENPMDKGAWQATFKGSRRVRHDWGANPFHLNYQWTSLVVQTVKCLPTMLETWVQALGGEDLLRRRKWQPNPVFLPGKSHRWRRLVGFSPWGCKESDTTEQLHFLTWLTYYSCPAFLLCPILNPQIWNYLKIHDHCLNLHKCLRFYLFVIPFALQTTLW